LKKEVKATGKTVLAAVEAGAKELGVTTDKVTYEIITEPKKKLFKTIDAEVLVKYELNPTDLAVEFINTLLTDMGIKADIEVTEHSEDGKMINVNGEGAGMLIGHHGETLDQLQYLVNLAANKKADENDDRDYTRITIDIEGYRAKREETLRILARKMAARVLRNKRSITLEPMSAYERRIIHSEIHDVAGVSTNSIGAENDRRIVIFPDNKKERNRD
jgi:spoIIIJ-associated protein